MVDKNEVVERILKLNSEKLPVEENTKGKHAPIYSGTPEVANLVLNSYFGMNCMYELRWVRPYKNYHEVMSELEGANNYKLESFIRLYNRGCYSFAANDVAPEVTGKYDFSHILGFCHDKQIYAYELEYRLHEFAKEFARVYNSVDLSEERVRELLDKFLSENEIDLNKETFEYVFANSYAHICTAEMERTLQEQSQNSDIMAYLKGKHDERKAKEIAAADAEARGQTEGQRNAETPADDEAPNM